MNATHATRSIPRSTSSSVTASTSAASCHRRVGVRDTSGNSWASRPGTSPDLEAEQSGTRSPRDVLGIFALSRRDLSSIDLGAVAIVWRSGESFAKFGLCGPQRARELRDLRPAEQYGEDRQHDQHIRTDNFSDQHDAFTVLTRSSTAHSDQDDADQASLWRGCVFNFAPAL